MPGPGLQTFIRHLCASASAQRSGRLTDAELLERFVRTRDGAAFEALVWRHAPMVVSVCRRVARRADAARECRPVLLDAEGKRYLPRVFHGGSSARRNGPVVVLQRWRM